MSHIHNYKHEEHNATSSKWYIWAVVAVLTFYLWTEHRAHLYGALPYLLFLLCPLMHLFMGHGEHNSHQHRSNNVDKKGV